jgi:hypothetical protein
MSKWWKNKNWYGVACGLPLLVACGNNEPDTPEDSGGELALELKGTSDVESVLLTVVGATRTFSACLPIDGQPTTKVSGLPTGSVVVSAAAHVTADCSEEPTWLADEQTVQLRRGQSVALQLPFRPNGVVQVSDHYEDDVPNFGCSAEVQRVPREAMSQDAAGPAGTGLLAVYDDGDQRQEGPVDYGPYVPGGSAPPHYPADVVADNSAPALWRSIWALGGETLTGFVTSPRSGPVTFTVSADDYAELDVGNGMGSFIIDHGPTQSTTVTLEAGQRYPLRLRYQNRIGSNWLRFYWQCPDVAAP